MGTGPSCRIDGSAQMPNENSFTAVCSEDFDRLWPQESNRLTAYSRASTHRPSRARRLAATKSSASTSGVDIMKALEAFCQLIPPSVDARKATREAHFSRKLHEYCSLRVSYWFMPPPPATLSSLMNQFRESKRIMWIMYLTATILQSLYQSPQNHGPLASGYIDWIDRLEQNITTGSPDNPPTNDTGDCLMAQLELAFLKFALVDNVSGYTTFQRALPRFLQTVASDSNSLMEDANGNLVVSFCRTINGPRNELRRFVLYDTVIALLLGVPTLAEYGYNRGCDSEAYGFEWNYGAPATLLQIISQVNSWRARSSVALDDWQTLEKRVLDWGPSTALLDGTSTTGHANLNVARAAVQEGWRHLALIYIYMGMCGVSSHDPRVQSSVDQIFELAESVANLRIGTQIFAHCVVVGVVARLEKHRIAVYEKLRSFRHTRVWIFDGLQFSEVLYHLWHGVGLGGAPVTWEDYAQSRRVVIPI
ncbi:hypothetical protein RHS03_05703, partial [Rhizoctonia solani]